MSQPTNNRPESTGGQVAMGCLASVVALPIMIGTTMLVGNLTSGGPVTALASIVAGLLYFVGMIVWAKRRGKGGMIIGLVIGLALFLLLGSACYGLLVSF